MKQSCGNIFRFPLHHGPTKGGKTERVKYKYWYERTLISYRSAFSTEAPFDIWSPSSVRFGKQDFRRIDTSSHFIIKKRHVVSAAILTASAIALAGCANSLAAVSDSNFPLDFICIIPVFVVIILVIIRIGRGGKGGGGGCGGGGD